MVPRERPAAVVHGITESCSRFGGVGPVPARHPVAELPEIRPDVAEYRRPSKSCPGCGVATRAPLPAGVPSGAFGPRPLATIGLPCGVDQPSKCQIRAALADMLGLSSSTSMFSKAERPAPRTVAEPVDRIDGAIRRAPALSVNETGWREGGRGA